MKEPKLGMKETIEWISANQRTVLYLFVMFIIAFPLFVPLGLPLKIGDHVRILYGAIEALPPGSTLLLVGGPAPGNPEMFPGALAIVRHLLTRGIKFITTTSESVNPFGSENWRVLFSQAKILVPGKQYGVDWAEMGFLVGEEIGIAALSKDFQATFLIDYYGNPISELDVAKNIKDIYGFKFVLLFQGRETDPMMWLRQVATPYRHPIYLYTGGPSAPIMMPYYPEQLKCVIFGARGGAEYELISEFKGWAIGSMDSISSSHLLLLGFVVIANIRYFSKNSKKRRK